MAEIFGEDFINTLPDDDVAAWLMVSERLRTLNKGASIDDILSAVAFVRVLDEKRPLVGIFEDILGAKPPTIPSYTNDPVEGRCQIDELCGYIESGLRPILAEHSSHDAFARDLKRYATLLPGAFYYVFTEDDFQRLQQLINELHSVTVKSSQITDSQKKRLLRRIEVLHSELHKRMSNLDRLWGIIAELGATRGKFGKDVRPLTDCLREVFDIVGRVMLAAHRLSAPSALPLAMAIDDPVQRAYPNDETDT